MHGMAAVQLAQGFQFVLKVPRQADTSTPNEQRILSSRCSKVFTVAEDDFVLAPPKLAEVVEVLCSTVDVQGNWRPTGLMTRRHWNRGLRRCCTQLGPS
jgi:hypothetical protein